MFCRDAFDGAGWAPSSVRFTSKTLYDFANNLTLEVYPTFPSFTWFIAPGRIGELCRAESTYNSSSKTSFSP